MKKRRKSLATVFTVAAIASHLPGLSSAQTYPAKPVRYIVPFPAAGSPDLVARQIAERLGRIWNQQVVVDNR